MTQPETAVGGSDTDTVVAVEPTIEERLSAISEEPDDEEEPLAGEPSDEELLAAEDDIEDEPDEGPAIDPPVSWDAEAKERFAKLPREDQEYLAKREAERERFVQSKAQEAARARQDVQAQAVQELTAINNQRLAQIGAMLPPIPDEPSEYLRAENPYQFAAEMENRKAIIAQHEYAAALANEVVQQQQAAEQALNLQKQQTNAALLQEHYPEFLDPGKRTELQAKLRSTALALGYSDSQLAHTDAVDILAIKTASEWKAKADKLDTLMAKQMARVREGKAAPKISRPGSPTGKGVQAGQRYAADRKAMQTGDKDATIRVFKNFL